MMTDCVSESCSTCGTAAVAQAADAVGAGVRPGGEALRDSAGMRPGDVPTQAGEQDALVVGPS